MRLRSRAVLTGLMGTVAVAVPVTSHAVTPADTPAPVTTGTQNDYQNMAGPYANLYACFAGREIFLMNGHPAWKMTDCIVFSDGRAVFFWNP